MQTIKMNLSIIKVDLTLNDDGEGSTAGTAKTVKVEISGQGQKINMSADGMLDSRELAFVEKIVDSAKHLHMH